MKYTQLLLRTLAALALISIMFPIAAAFEGVEVTAPGLVALAILSAALMIFRRGVDRFLASHRMERQVRFERAGGLARLTGSVELLIPRMLEKRARHEAAHAVVAHALGHTVLSASVQVTAASGGRVVWQHKDDARASVDHIAVAFAGPLAEHTGDIVQSTRGDDDYPMLMRISIAAAVTDAEHRTPSEILDAGTRSARLLVTEHAEAIEAVAQVLVSTKGERNLDEVEIRGLMQHHHVLPATS